MDTSQLQISDAQRSQLDGIVHKMTQNGEKDSAIQFVVDDFKQKYGSQPQQQDGFLKSAIKDPLSTLVVKPAVRFGEALAAPIVNTFGNDQQKQRYNDLIKQGTTLNTDISVGNVHVPILGNINVEGQKSFGEGGGKQILGDALKSGSYLAGGSEPLAGRIGLEGIKKVGALAAENAALGGAYQTGQNLIEGKPALENVGATAAVGAAIPFVGAGISKLKDIALQKAGPMAETLINSLIKPLSKDFAYGKDPARGILNEGIVANSFDELVPQVQQKISEVGSKIGAVGDLLDQSGVVLNLTPGLKPIDDAIQQAAKSNNTALFSSLNNVKTALMHDMTAGEVGGVPTIVKGDPKNLIAATYGDAKNFLSDIASHTKFTGNPSDDKALNAATKQAYGAVRDIMNRAADSVDPQVGQQIRNLNERYGDLLSAQNAINHRDIVLKRQNFLKLADKFSIPVTIASAVGTGLLTGDYAKAGAVLASGLGAIAAEKAAGSTAAKTRVAQFLSRLPTEQRVGILNSTPVLKNLYERATGQVSPGEGAPKSAALSALQDYLKSPQAGLSVKNVGEDAIRSVAKKIDGTDKAIMTKFIDLIRLRKPENPDAEIMARRIIEDMGFNPDVPNSRVAEIFTKILDTRRALEKGPLKGAGSR